MIMKLTIRTSITNNDCLNIKTHIYNVLILVLLINCTACNKYLDEKPDKKLVVPSTIQDAQALLDNTRAMNIIYPASGEIASDDFYLQTTDWLALGTNTEKNSYIWGADVFNDVERNDWSLPYITVNYSNTILDALETSDITDGSEADRNNIKGQALYYRAFAFYNLIQLFAKQWDATTAASDPGIALRLSPDFNIPTTRASVQQCYEQIIDDAKLATTLLPDAVPVLTRPSKVAANAFLARVYLAMANYTEALNYANSAMQVNSTLLDFNTLNTAAAFPFARFNKEVLMQTLLISRAVLYPPTLKIDTTLYKSYDDNDLRKSLYFSANADRTYSFKGSYDGSSVLFNGPSTDELYLIRSECYARQSKLDLAMKELNDLLVKRWKTDKMTGKSLYIPQTASNQLEALDKILRERRKELIFRGLRWHDLKRLNKEPVYAKPLKRNIGGHEYVLLPNDNKYAFPLPVGIILASGIPQNER
jgi:tetratricopeptide (TPR) repeat protein